MPSNQSMKTDVKRANVTFSINLKISDLAPSLKWACEGGEWAIGNSDKN